MFIETKNSKFSVSKQNSRSTFSTDLSLPASFCLGDGGRRNQRLRTLTDIGFYNADDDVDYTPVKPKKPEQHKYSVKAGVKIPQKDGSLLNAVTASTPDIHSGCNEPETLRITENAHQHPPHQASVNISTCDGGRLRSKLFSSWSERTEEF
ncbi:hypothetical protein PoB_002529500 [Plakobranchus ocellatus]|uniref:Uncharacterized protein n=1 Tax=Plakobranchus ocellatus TaxID=259542 RepID=A0AAV3ZUG8_9GAST|nr:hypothetical protein PoB_002529500 [Plakobranchus ocellatus]